MESRRKSGLIVINGRNFEFRSNGFIYEKVINGRISSNERFGYARRVGETYLAHTSNWNGPVKGESIEIVIEQLLLL